MVLYRQILPIFKVWYCGVVSFCSDTECVPSFSSNIQSLLSHPSYSRSIYCPSTASCLLYLSLYVFNSFSSLFLQYATKLAIEVFWKNIIVIYRKDLVFPIFSVLGLLLFPLHPFPFPSPFCLSISGFLLSLFVFTPNSIFLSYSNIRISCIFNVWALRFNRFSVAVLIITLPFPMPKQNEM